MAHDFILIRKRILDYAMYKEEFKAMASAVQWGLADALQEAGFGCARLESAGYSSHMASFYHEGLDMKVTLHICKKDPEAFI